MRIYLNLCVDVFSYLDLNIFDNRKVRELIFKHGHMLIARFWHETNLDFFYEFLDNFNKFSLSFCFKNSARKPEFGPYYPHAFDITFSVNF